MSESYDSNLKASRVNMRAGMAALRAQFDSCATGRFDGFTADIPEKAWVAPVPEQRVCGMLVPAAYADAWAESERRAWERIVVTMEHGVVPDDEEAGLYEQRAEAQTGEGGQT